MISDYLHIQSMMKNLSFYKIEEEQYQSDLQHQYIEHQTFHVHHVFR